MKKTKYKWIGKFAEAAGLSRAGAFKALERNDPQMWGKYAAYLEKRNRRALTALEDAQARVSNARNVSITAALAAQ